MKRLPRLALAAALFAGALAGIPSLAFAGNLPAAIDGSVAVMHTNDIHGSYKYSYNASKGTGTVGFDGLAVLYSAQSSVPDLLLDAGDTFHGQSFATMSEGKSIAELMDTFYADGYDATTPGNHDWSYGADKLRTMTGYSTTARPSPCSARTRSLRAAYGARASRRRSIAPGRIAKITPHSTTKSRSASWVPWMSR